MVGRETAEREVIREEMSSGEAGASDRFLAWERLIAEWLPEWESAKGGY